MRKEPFMEPEIKEQAAPQAEERIAPQAAREQESEEVAVAAEATDRTPLIIGVAAAVAVVVLVVVLACCGVFGGSSDEQSDESGSTAAVSTDSKSSSSEDEKEDKSNEQTAEQGDKSATEQTNQEQSTDSASTDQAAAGSSAAGSSTSGSASGGSSSSSSGGSSSGGSSSGGSGGGGSSGGSTPSQPDTKTITVSVQIDGSRAGSQDCASMSTKKVELEENATVFDALLACGVTYSGSGEYVSAINGLAEKQCGALSGWKYKVNGEYPNMSCGKYVLSGGETIIWKYVLDPNE